LLAQESIHIKNSLKEALQKKLPGEDAHRLMLPLGRDLYPEEGKGNIIQSSVLLILFPDNDMIHICLIKRPAGMRHHAGQIAFPGGRFEPSDNNLIQTALRESFEEIGVHADQLEIIGALTPIYVQVSNFAINPFIGWCKARPFFKTEQGEVDELFIIPIEKLLHPQTPQTKEVITSRGNFNAPGYVINTLFIWGATAMILSEFNQIYRSIPQRQL